MKSAYELAMERLEQASGPSKKLTDAQKAAIADIDRKYDARIAEVRVGHEGRLAAASSHEELQQVRQELADEIRRIEEKREFDKSKVWEEG